MIRRPRIETKINHERWLVSYADFVTLLFAFFVVMYSVSQVNESKYRTLSATLQSVFDPKYVGDESVPDGQAQFELGSLASILAELEGQSAEYIDSAGIKTRGNEQWVAIELDANLLFNSGEAQINPSANQGLDAVAKVLLKHNNAIAVEGHTDNLPISTARFDDNWQLSAARAVSVLNYLAFQGVEPDQLSAIGYGEYRPVADNASAEGRAKNRRVVIRVAHHETPSSETFEQNASAAPNQEAGMTQQSNGDVSAEPARAKLNELPESIEAVRLKGGGLLFSSDPDLPRSNAPVTREPLSGEGAILLPRE